MSSIITKYTNPESSAQKITKYTNPESSAQKITKYTQLTEIVIDTNTATTYSFQFIPYINAKKFKISLGGFLGSLDASNRAIQVYSNISNSVIGVVMCEFDYKTAGLEFIYSDSPTDGIEFIQDVYPSTYQLHLSKSDGTAITAQITGTLFVNIESWT